MAVNPLDPTKPVLNDPVEVSAELRGLKGVLVPLKNTVDGLHELLEGFSGFSTFGKDWVGSANPNAALDKLLPSVVGKSVFTITSWEALAANLGVADPTPKLVTGSPGCSCVILPGDFKINCIYGAFADQALHNFASPFTTGIYGVAATLMQDENTDLQCYSESLSQIRVSFGGAGTKKYSVIAIGR